jgi:hypothetical protein
MAPRPAEPNGQKKAEKIPPLPPLPPHGRPEERPQEVLRREWTTSQMRDGPHGNRERPLPCSENQKRKIPPPNHREEFFEKGPPYSPV